jgi:hypothetical protein
LSCWQTPVFPAVATPDALVHRALNIFLDEHFGMIANQPVLEAAIANNHKMG